MRSPSAIPPLIQQSSIFTSSVEYRTDPQSRFPVATLQGFVSRHWASSKKKLARSRSSMPLLSTSYQFEWKRVDTERCSWEFEFVSSLGVSQCYNIKLSIYSTIFFGSTSISTDSVDWICSLLVHIWNSFHGHLLSNGPGWSRKNLLKQLAVHSKTEYRIL